jgi:hypothetical protein
MTIEQFFKVIDLRNINRFMINNELVSLSYINNVLSNNEIDNVKIITEYVPMTSKDIHTVVLSDTLEDVVQYINAETHLPNSPSYISITINIKIKERRNIHV